MCFMRFFGADYNPHAIFIGQFCMLPFSQFSQSTMSNWLKWPYFSHFIPYANFVEHITNGNFDLTDSFSSSRTQPYAGSDGYVNNLLDGKEHTFRQFCWASRKEQQQQRWGKQLRAAWELIPSSRLYAKIIQIIDRLVKRGLSAT